MKMNSFFKVAGHVFEVKLNDDASPLFFASMDNYAPFKLESVDGLPLAFSLEIFTENVRVDFVEETRQVDEGQEIICGKNAESLPTFEFLLGGKSTGVLVCHDEFQSGSLYVNGTLPANFQKFALNNSLMVLYALATSCKNTVLFHSAVIARENRGYMFLGKSGTGKSTHARMWLRRFSNADLLNDDNPVVRLEEDGVWVYGTPWSGKTPCYKNSRVPLAGIVNLSQAPQNKIRPIKGIEAYMALVVSISGMRWDKKVADGLHATENRLAQEVKMFHLECLPDENAAEVCYGAFTEVSAQ